ncbi:putative membrane protein [Pseudomonas ogarae]|nr:putative membrane protein [Pseudomonas ogarae]
MFLGAQTLIVLLWISLNLVGVFHFDAYPFILLNLAFSLQSAYAAPLILLAQTRQAARDKAQAEADAQHREALAVANSERQAQAAQNTAQLLELLEQNTRLTEMTKALTERIDNLTTEMHRKVVHNPSVQ